MSITAGASEAGPAPRVRPYAPGDELELNRAFREVFGVERDLSEWRWKFLDAPLAGRTIVAFEDGRAVAQYAAIPAAFRHPRRPLTGGQVVDVFCVHRRGLDRRGGLFARLVDAFIAEFCGAGRLDFSFGFPHQRAQRVGAFAGHYREPLPIPVWKSAARARPRRRPFTLRVLEGFDAAALDALWLRSAARYPFAAERGARRLGWRLVARPGTTYRLFFVHDRGAARAFAAVRSEPGRLRWVDLVWDGERREHFAALEAALQEAASEEGAAEIELWLGGDPLASGALEELGWRSAPLAEGVLQLRAFAPDLDEEELKSTIYFTAADSDLV